MPAQVSSFAGGFGDELALGTIGFFAAKGKLGKNQMIKDLGKAVLVIESARVATGIKNGIAPSTSSSSTDWN